MMVDNSLLLSDDQANTLAAASTNMLDQVAAGEDFGDCWFVVIMKAAAVAQIGSPTTTFQIQTCASTASGNFGGPTAYTVLQSGAFTVAQLDIGKYWAVKLPAGCKQYIRGFSNPSGVASPNCFSTLTYDMMIVRDLSIEINRRRLVALY